MSNDWQDIYTDNEEAAKQDAEELKQKMKDKKSVWRCDECGDMYDPIDTAWRYDPVNGPQHYHSSIQCHASSTRFDELERKNSERITRQELIQLFGDHIPLEAVMLLSSETDADSLRKQLTEMAEKGIADQFRERLEAIVQPGADWYNEPNVELNLYSPNEILTMVCNLERMIYYLESGAGY